MEYFHKIVQMRVAKKNLIIYLMLGRLLFREIRCFHTSINFYSEINYFFWLKTNILTGHIGNSLSLACLASLARNLEFCLASRKTSKMQEIAHYSIYQFASIYRLPCFYIVYSTIH